MGEFDGKSDDDLRDLLNGTRAVRDRLCAEIERIEERIDDCDAVILGVEHELWLREQYGSEEHMPPLSRQLNVSNTGMMIEERKIRTSLIFANPQYYAPELEQIEAEWEYRGIGLMA